MNPLYNPINWIKAYIVMRNQEKLIRDTINDKGLRYFIENKDKILK